MCDRSKFSRQYSATDLSMVSASPPTNGTDYNGAALGPLPAPTTPLRSFCRSHRIVFELQVAPRQDAPSFELFAKLWNLTMNTAQQVCHTVTTFLTTHAKLRARQAPPKSSGTSAAYSIVPRRRAGGPSNFL